MSGKAIYGRRATRKLAAQASSPAPTASPSPITPATTANQYLHRSKGVAAYIRISTDELHSPAGATLERPGLKKALAAAKAGKFDILLVTASTGSPGHRAAL